MPEDIADYLLDNYGSCDAEPCRCRKHGWQGRTCTHWHPCGARTLEELRIKYREQSLTEN